MTISFLTIFHGVIQVLKQLLVSGTRGVTTEIMKLHRNNFENSEQSKNDSLVSGTPGILDSPASWTQEILDSWASRTPWSHESPASQMKASWLEV